LLAVSWVSLCSGRLAVQAGAFGLPYGVVLPPRFSGRRLWFAVRCCPAAWFFRPAALWLPFGVILVRAGRRCCGLAFVSVWVLPRGRGTLLAVSWAFVAAASLFRRAPLVCSSALSCRPAFQAGGLVVAVRCHSGPGGGVVGSPLYCRLAFQAGAFGLQFGVVLPRGARHVARSRRTSRVSLCSGRLAFQAGAFGLHFARRCIGESPTPWRWLNEFGVAPVVTRKRSKIKIKSARLEKKGGRHKSKRGSRLATLSRPIAVAVNSNA